MNPYAPPAMDVGTPSGELGPLVEEHEVGTPSAPRTRYRLSFHPDHLVAARGDGEQRLVLSRADITERAQLILGSLGRVLSVRGVASIPLTPPAVTALRRLLDRNIHAHLAATLKKRVWLSLPLGVLVVLGSFAGDTLARVSSAVVGGSLIALALAAKLSPRRWVFLLDFVVWLVLAANAALGVAAGTSSRVWSLIVVLNLVLAMGSIRLYRFYEPVRS